MIVTGVDGALGSTGLASYDMESGTVLDLSKIRTSIRKATPTESSRILAIYNDFTLYLSVFRPDIVVAENQHVGPNRQTALGLARVRGAIQLACVQAGIPFVVVEPSTIKRVTTGKGNASKEDIQDAVLKLFHNSRLVQEKLKVFIGKGKDKTDDLADALATIYTYKEEPKTCIAI